MYLNPVPLLLLIKIFKTDGSDIESAKPNTHGCVNNLLHEIFSSLSVSLNGKPVTLHETKYHHIAYIEELLNVVPTRLARILSPVSGISIHLELSKTTVFTLNGYITSAMGTLYNYMVTTC